MHWIRSDEPLASAFERMFVHEIKVLTVHTRVAPPHLGAVHEHSSAEAKCSGLLPPRPLKPAAPCVRRDQAIIAQPQHKGVPLSAIASLVAVKAPRR